MKPAEKKEPKSLTLDPVAQENMVRLMEASEQGGDEAVKKLLREIRSGGRAVQ